MPLKRELGPFWSQTLCVDAVDAQLSPESTIETTETELHLLVLLAPQSTLHPAPEPARFLVEKNPTHDWSTASERECKTG